MAPFFELDIIELFKKQIPMLNDMIFLTNGSSDLDNYLPNIIEHANDVCRGFIGNEYLENAILSNAFNENINYDAVVLFENNDNMPLAFLIVEKNECRRLPDVWSVNLICAKDKSKNNKKGLGQILMGLYLFTIVHNPIIAAKDKYGILELAGGYINVTGLASYSKLNFEVDEDLWGDECFSDYNNLPMATNGIDCNRIIDILNNRDVGYTKPKICYLRGNMQLYLGICKNLYIYMFNVPANLRDKYIRTHHNLEIVENVKQKLQIVYETRQQKRQRQQTNIPPIASDKNKAQVHTRTRTRATKRLRSPSQPLIKSPSQSLKSRRVAPSRKTRLRSSKIKNYITSRRQIR